MTKIISTVQAWFNSELEELDRVGRNLQVIEFRYSRMKYFLFQYTDIGFPIPRHRTGLLTSNRWKIRPDMLTSLQKNRDREACGRVNLHAPKLSHERWPPCARELAVKYEDLSLLLLLGFGLAGRVLVFGSFARWSICTWGSSCRGSCRQLEGFGCQAGREKLPEKSFLVPRTEVFGPPYVSSIELVAISGGRVQVESLSQLFSALL